MESHALHIYLLHAPDFLGYESNLDFFGERERGDASAIGTSANVRQAVDQQDACLWLPGGKITR